MKQKGHGSQCIENKTRKEDVQDTGLNGNGTDLDSMYIVRTRMAELASVGRGPGPELGGTLLLWCLCSPPALPSCL